MLMKKLVYSQHVSESHQVTPQDSLAKTAFGTQPKILRHPFLECAKLQEAEDTPTSLAEERSLLHQCATTASGTGWLG